MNIAELQKAIESYPHRLYEALEAVDKAEKAIEKLNEHIEEEEAILSPGSESETESGLSVIEQQEALIKLDHELALLTLRKAQIEGEIELEHRRNPPAGLKVTEGLIFALINSNPQVVEVKERCLEKKRERETANISRRVGYVAKQAEVKEPVTSPKLEKLRDRLLTAEMTLAGAEMRLKEMKAGMRSYQLLVQLYTAGLVT